jgi:hypothetical protein
MLEFKGTLYKSMEDPKIDFTSLENTVRLLLELEPESDPVWHYLNVQVGIFEDVTLLLLLTMFCVESGFLIDLL